MLFADIVGFTAFSSGKQPSEVVKMLSELFMEFDKQCDSLGLFKLYTIGDCYVVLSFIDVEKRSSPEKEAKDMIIFAEILIHLINKVRKKINFMDLNMRIGVHTGDIYGGIAGTDIVRFDVYGENVFAANKMESGGQAGKICVSETTKMLLEKDKGNKYKFDFNSDIYIKSMGKDLKSYFIGR